MARRPPSAVRQREATCRSHDRAVHQVGGLSGGVTAAITVIEHGHLVPGSTRAAFGQWRRLAVNAAVCRPASNSCGIEDCCGPGPRAVLETVLYRLPGWARPEFRRVIKPVDELFLAGTLPDPCAGPGAPWWEQRIPRGLPVSMAGGIKRRDDRQPAARQRRRRSLSESDDLGSRPVTNLTRWTTGRRMPRGGTASRGPHIAAVLAFSMRR